MKRSRGPNLELGTNSLNCICYDSGQTFVRIKLHFKDSQGNHLRTIEGNEGDNILDLAHEYDIDLEGESDDEISKGNLL